MGEKNLCTSLMGNPPLLNDVLKGNSAGKDEDTIFNSDIELLHNSFLNHYCGLARSKSFYVNKMLEVAEFL